MTSRREVLVGAATLAVPLVPMLGREASAYNLPQWHALSQGQRNAAIVARGNQSLYQKVKQSCKEWVRTVVRDVSGNGAQPPNSVGLPSTRPAPYDYMWVYDDSGNTIGMSMPINNVVPGYIVQMRLSSGWPHTAIVAGNSGSSITFVESNWDDTPGDETDAYVRPRTVTYAQFYAQLQSTGSFSVYYVR